MSELLIKAIEEALTRPRSSRLTKTICLLVALHIMICLGIGLFLIKQKTVHQEKPDNIQILDQNPCFFFHDLRLPLWAQGFIMPIPGAKVPENRNLLPGAPRSYRNGRHQGMDLYCLYGTPVLAAKDGYVVLDGSDHANSPPMYRKRLLEISNMLFETPLEILGLLHGKRVILDHGIINSRWVVTGYSHLSEVRKDLRVGDFVQQGEVIGYVGNSGTSKAGTQRGAHLHFEIRVNGHYLGQGMRPIEAKALLKAILEGNDYDKPNRNTVSEVSGTDRFPDATKEKPWWERFIQKLPAFGSGK